MCIQVKMFYLKQSILYTTQVILREVHTAYNKVYGSFMHFITKNDGSHQ